MSDMIQNQRITRRENGTLLVETINDEPSKTQQQFAEECDINNIMRKYNTTGEFTHKTSRQGIYADFSEITEYRQMLDQVSYAKEAFALLPAEIRKRFRNDPAELLDFVQNPENLEEGISLGLFERKAPLPESLPSPSPKKSSKKSLKSPAPEIQDPLPLDAE